MDEMRFEECDDANVPVDIWLRAPDEDCRKFVLHAGNYMPRKGVVTDHAYHQEFDTRDEAVACLKKYVLPMYETALLAIHEIAAGARECLYYWDRPDA